MVHDCADRSCYWAKAQGDTAVAGTGWDVVRRMTKSVKNRRKTRNAKTYRKFEMSNFKPIRTEADYSAALARIAELMDSVPDSPESEELDALADLLEMYEERHMQMGYPSPIAAIEFRMDQAGLSPRDLIPFIGSRVELSEILSGKRAITIPMARALQENLGVQADVLLQKPERHI